MAIFNGCVEVPEGTHTESIFLLVVSSFSSSVLLEMMLILDMLLVDLTISYPLMHPVVFFDLKRTPLWLVRLDTGMVLLALPNY